MRLRPGYLAFALCFLALASMNTASLGAAEQPAKLLLLSQGPDGHPVSTHEYVAGLEILGKLLRDVPLYREILASLG